MNVCCLNAGWGSFSKTKSHSGLGSMQAWFSAGEPIHGCGPCVPDLAPHWPFRVGAGLHLPYHMDRFPIFPPLFLVKTAIDPIKLATCWSLTQPWENNWQMHQSTQNIISKQPVAPKTYILVEFIKPVFWVEPAKIITEGSKNLLLS